MKIFKADNGICIPKDEKKIFNEFYKSSILKQKRTEGIGLGLALVEASLARLNGKIMVKSSSYFSSKSRPYTRFIINFPYMVELTLN